MGVMAMAISMMLYLGKEKVTLMEKELQGIVEDFRVARECEYKRVCIMREYLIAQAEEINCMSACGDDDPDRFCFKKCTSKVRIHKDNTRTEQEAIT